ncbi:gp53-like domain-containing protein [Pasteurella bettyae]|uniref:phage baseplate protein n=1 Tax=Pasteurella bettyae TaxID=752 RepID=UPI003D2DDB79
MGHFDKNAKWHDKIYQIERTDPVVGGEGGISNRAPMELAERTEWLKQQIELQQCDSIAELRTIEPTTDKQTIFVKGYHAGSTKGGGYFIADLADNASVDNAGTVIVTGAGKRWTRIYYEITPFDFGAKSGWLNNSESAFIALEQAMQGQAVNLCGLVFTCDTDKVKNRYYNGYIASNSTGSGAKGKGFIGSYKHLYDLNSQYGTKFSELVPVYVDKNAPSYYSQGVAQDPRTGDIWQIQSGDNNHNALVKHKFSLFGKSEAVGHVFNNSIGHQSLGIYYEGDTRYFVTMVGSVKGNERALYVARFTINESNWTMENLKYQRVFNAPVTGNATRCMAIDPNGSVIAITNGADEPTENGTVYKWGCSVFHLADLFHDDFLDIPPTPISKFHIFRDVLAGTNTGKAVQDIACDGEFIYVLNGGSQQKYENTIDVYTINGVHVLRDDKNLTGFDICQAVKNAGGGMYYEPEGLFFLRNNDGLMLCMSVISGAEKGKTIKNTHIVAMASQYQSILRGTTNTPAQYVYADGTAFAFPRGKPLKFGELQSNGEIWKGLALNRTYAEFAFEDNTQPQFRVANSLHKGMLQVSSSGNFGLYDITQNKWLVYSSLDGVAKLQNSPSNNANGDEIPTARWVNQKLKFESHHATNGWQRLPNGLIFQWGRYDATNARTFNFPIAFTGTPYVVQCTDYNDNGSQVNALTTTGLTNTKFDVIVQGAIGAFSMFAIGR